MLIYHGTSARHLDDALVTGIRARMADKSNWDDAPSRSDMVYLTVGYPFYYALVGNDDPKVVVFEIDLAELDEDKLHPDEDYVFERAREMGAAKETLTQEAVAEYLDVMQDMWPKSLAVIGNIAYQGVISASAITRYCLFDRTARPNIAFALTDYSISALNYAYERYNLDHLIGWMFDDTDLLPMAMDDECEEEYRQFWATESGDRTGIEVVEV